MDDDLLKFEDMLKNLEPRKLSDETMQAIDDIPAREMRIVTDDRSRSNAMRFVGLAAAASFLMAFTALFYVLSMDTQMTVPIADKDQIKPVPDLIATQDAIPEPIDLGPAPSRYADETSSGIQVSPVSTGGPFGQRRTVTGIHDEGVIYRNGSRPSRRMRRDYVNEIRIKDPSTGRTVIIQEPKSETYYIDLEDY